MSSVAHPDTASTSAETQAPLITERHVSVSGEKQENSPTGTRRDSRAQSLKPKMSLLAENMKPEKQVGPPPSVLKSLRSILFASWLNVLLVCIPISWALNFTHHDDHTLVFVFSFLAIIPLAKLLAFATEELSMRVGQTLAGLMNATLGNAVELIVAIIALIKCEIHIVQSSLVGSILSNLLLVLGMCFFAGGTRFSEQGFGISSTQLNSSLLTISVIAVLLPAAFHAALTPAPNGTDPITDAAEGADVLKLSHGIALILLFIYACYLFFQLSSHKTLYDDSGADVVKSTVYRDANGDPKRHRTISDRLHRRAAAGTPAKGTANVTEENGQTGSVNGENTNTDLEANGEPKKEEEEVETPSMSVWMTIGLLAVVTVLVAVTAEWLVDSIDGLTSSGTISKEFVGIILLPIVGNAAEHVTAVTVSVKDKLTLSLGVAVGSSIQIALFVIPFIVTLGWILGKPMTLLFDPYESIVLFLAVITVNYVVQDGKSNWLEGMILMCLYVIAGTTFWFYPGSDPSGVLAVCK